MSKFNYIEEYYQAFNRGDRDAMLSMLTDDATAKSSVIYLAEVLRIRRGRRFGNGDPGSGAETSNVVYMSRGPRPRQRV